MYRILIVEDDSTIASNVAAHLERWDYETKQIEDFKCVMEAFQQFDPQLVILDIGLPFIMDFTGVRRYVKSQVCRFFFYHQ